MSSRKTVSMKLIAEEAGVSVMTVSRVLSNQSNVSPHTEEKIREIANRVGYKANRLVRGMQSGRSGIISVVLPIGHSLAPRMMEGAYDFFHEKDMIMAVDLVHGNLGEKAISEQSKIINRLLECRIDGILLLPVNEDANPVYFKEIVDRKIPLVLMDRNTNQFVADFVGTDDYAGGMEAARLLVKNGCKKPVLVSVGKAVSTSRERARGFKDGLKKLKVKLVEEIVAPNFLANEDLMDESIAKLKGKFDGVFGVADRLAISAWHACKLQGLDIPERVKIIGFGALDLRDPRVAISSFDQDAYAIGRNAAQLLFQRIDKGLYKRRPKAKSLLNMPNFVEGTSCPFV